jgi:hypothetical protein
MSGEAEFTQERILEMFQYSRHTGVLIWKCASSCRSSAYRPARAALGPRTGLRAP